MQALLAKQSVQNVETQKNGLGENPPKFISLYGKIDSKPQEQ